MYMGQLLMVPDNAASLTLWTPWMRRGADNARFTYEVIAKLGTPTFTVDVYHKDSESLVTDGTSLGVSFASTSVGNTTFYDATAEDLKEMIRFKLTLSASSTKPEMVVYRFHEPTWYDSGG